MFTSKGRKQFEKSVEFVSALSRIYFRSKIKKVTICKFWTKFLRENFLWNWEAFFDNPADFIFRQKDAQCPKRKEQEGKIVLR